MQHTHLLYLHRLCQDIMGHSNDAMGFLRLRAVLWVPLVPDLGCM